MSQKLACAAPDPGSPALEFASVRIDRGDQTILDQVSFTVRRGAVVAVLGPSGAGKSTLMHAITGELCPVAGSIRIFGRAIDYSNHGLMSLRCGIGVLLQGNGLLSDLTVAENIALPLRVHTTLDAALISRLVDLKLNAVGLRSARDLYPRELSGGMARRVAFARALALDPPLMLYDEPLTGLDPIATGVIVELIGNLNRIMGMTSIVITHHVKESLSIADQVLVVANGGIAFSGTPAALAGSTDPLLRQFLDGKADGPIAFDAGRRHAAEVA